MLHKWLSNGSISLTRSESVHTIDLKEVTTPLANSAMTSSGNDRNTMSSSNGQKPEDRANRWTKYKPALKTLLPYRFRKAPQATIPSSNSGLISYVTISWLTSRMWKALKTGLTKEDLWELDDKDKADRNARRLNRLWEEEKLVRGSEASFFRCAWRFGKTRFSVCAFLMVFTVLIQFLVPAWILRWILSYIDDFSQPVEVGVSLALLILIAQCIRSLSFCGLFMIGIHTGIRLEGAMQCMTYEKLLRLRTGGEGVLAKAVTFCTNDQERIFECVAGGVLALAAPVMFTMSVIYTLLVLGPWALVGNAVIFLFYPVMGGIAACVARIRRKTVKQTNNRISLMNEILNAIRLIKMNGWEESFAEKIAAYRAVEEKELRKAAFLQSLTVTTSPMVNIAASVATFLGYSLSGNDLDASKAWSIYSVFAAMQFTVGTLPFAARSIAESAVCFRNFQKYLDLPEHENITNESLPCDHDSVVVIQDADFAWEVPIGQNENKDEGKKKKGRKSKFSKSKKKGGGTTPESDALAEVLEVEEPVHCLTNVNVDIKRGKLVGISGMTGSGKSSLCSAILGDMKKLRGDVLIRGSLAIVSQQAWIYSDTFQDNILFGSPMIKEKYDKVLEVCNLQEDMAQLPNGDLTVIGDRGVTLSGGQKQRLNLARAIYADRSIYILDDPLSAVDAVVGQSIFQNCIKQYLKGKTILLVTHQVEFLQQCDDIIFFKDGTVVESGKHDALIKQEQNYYHLFQHAHKREGGALREADSPVKELRRPLILSSKTQDFDYDKDDDVDFKDSGWRSYVHFIRAGGGWCVFLTVFTMACIFVSTRIFITVWVRTWVDHRSRVNITMEDEQAISGETVATLNETDYLTTRGLNETSSTVMDPSDQALFQSVLAGSVVIAYIFGAFKGLASTRFVLRAASSMHNMMFARIMKCPLAFFDSSPVGRVMNRFSKDMDELDARLPFFVEFVTDSLLYIVATIATVCAFFPIYVSFVLLLIFGVMLFFGAWLNVGVRQTKKLDNILKSPVVGHLQSSMGGLSIIRTYSRQTMFLRRFTEHLNRHLAAEAVFRIANRWFTVRMDLIGLAAIFFSALFGVLLRSSISPGVVGLVVSSIYSVCTFMPFVMRMMSELSARFTSVERILHYGMGLEVESEPEKPLELAEHAWPSKGEIRMESITMRYRPELPVVLDNVTLSIKGGEKIGIVGRTGAGKSSIMAVLLRLCDLDNGSIHIDDIDVTTVTRKVLRQRVAVIPQEPVLFKGTIRYNLDPFDTHTDEELWDALERSNLKAKISKIKKNLLSSVEAEGENFSVGEKQLMCLTRAILRKNKILLLDEATASVDVETDALIQSSLRSTFEDCTVLTIAHRLNTIANYDRVVVMDSGKVREFDTPENLIKLETSKFFKMMKAAGITSLDQIRLPGSEKTTTAATTTTTTTTT